VSAAWCISGCVVHAIKGAGGGGACGHRAWRMAEDAEADQIFVLAAWGRPDGNVSTPRRVLLPPAQRSHDKTRQGTI